MLGWQECPRELTVLTIPGRDPVVKPKFIPQSPTGGAMLDIKIYRMNWDSVFLSNEYNPVAQDIVGVIVRIAWGLDEPPAMVCVIVSPCFVIGVGWTAALKKRTTHQSCLLQGIRDYRVMNTPGYTRLPGHEYPRVYEITGSWISQVIRDYWVMNIPGYTRLPSHEYPRVYEIAGSWISQVIRDYRVMRSWIPQVIRDDRVMNTQGYTRLPSHKHPRVYEITGSWISRRTQVYRVVNTPGYTRGNPRNGKGNTKHHTAEAKEKGEQWTWRMKCQHPRLCPDVSRYSLWSPSVGVEQVLQDNKQTRQFKSVKEKKLLTSLHPLYKWERCCWCWRRRTCGGCTYKNKKSDVLLHYSLVCKWTRASHRLSSKVLTKKKLLMSTKTINSVLTI